MFDADISLSPTISDDDDLLSPWDDTDDAPIPIVEPDEEEDDLIVPKPIKPLDEDDEEDEDGDVDLLLDDDIEDTL